MLEELIPGLLEVVEHIVYSTVFRSEDTQKRVSQVVADLRSIVDRHTAAKAAAAAAPVEAPAPAPVTAGASSQPADPPSTPADEAEAAERELAEESNGAD